MDFDASISAFERLKPVCVPVMRAVTEVSRAREFPGEVERGPAQEQELVHALEQLLAQLVELAPASTVLELPRCVDYVLLPLFLVLPPTPDVALEDERQWRRYFEDKRGNYPAGCLSDRAREFCFRCMSTVVAAVGRESLYQDIDRVNGVLTRVILLLGADTSHSSVWSEDCRRAAIEAAVAVFPEDELPPPLDQPLWLARLIHALLSEQSASWSIAGRRVRRTALELLRAIASLPTISPLRLLPFLPGVASAVSATAAGLRPVRGEDRGDAGSAAPSTALVADGSRLGLAIQALGCACLAAWTRACLSDEWLERLSRRPGVVEPPLLGPVPSAREAWLQMAMELRGGARVNSRPQEPSSSSSADEDAPEKVEVPPWFTLDRRWLEQSSVRLRRLCASILTHLTPWAASHGAITSAVLALADAILLHAPRAIALEARPCGSEENRPGSDMIPGALSSTASDTDVDPVQLWTLAVEQVGVLGQLGRATSDDRMRCRALVQTAWSKLRSQGVARVERAREQIVARWRSITRSLGDDDDYDDDDKLVARLHGAAVWSGLAPHTLMNESVEEQDWCVERSAGTFFPTLFQPVMEHLARLLSPVAYDPLPGDARPHAGSGSAWLPSLSLGRARVPRVRTAVAVAVEALGQAMVRAEQGSLEACVRACFAMARKQWRGTMTRGGRDREAGVTSAGWCAVAMGLVEGARHLGLPSTASDDLGPGPATGLDQAGLCSDMDHVRKRVCDAARVLLWEAADSHRHSSLALTDESGTAAEASKLSLWDLQGGVVGSRLSHAASLVHIMLLACVSVSARVLGPWFVQELPRCAMQLLRRAVDPVESVQRYAQDVWTVVARYTARRAVEDDVVWVTAIHEIPIGLLPALAPRATLFSFVTHHWGLLVDGLVASVESLALEAQTVSSESDLETLPRILLFLLPLVRPSDAQQERWIPPDRLPWLRDLALALERAVYALRMQSSPGASGSLRLVLRALGGVVDCLAGSSTSSHHTHDRPTFLQATSDATNARDGIRRRVQDRLRAALEADTAVSENGAEAPEGKRNGREAERQRFRAWDWKPPPLLPRPGLRTSGLGLDDCGMPPPSIEDPPPLPIRQLLARILRVAGRTLVSKDAGVCIAALHVWRKGASALAGAPATLNPLLHDHWGPYLHLWTVNQPPVVRITAIETLVHWVGFGACGSFLQSKVRDSLFPCILSILWETTDRLMQQEERPSPRLRPVIRRSDLFLENPASPEKPDMSEASSSADPDLGDSGEVAPESAGILPKPPHHLDPGYRVAFTALQAIRLLSARIAVPVERGAGPETSQGGDNEEGEQEEEQGESTDADGRSSGWSSRRRDARAVEKALERRTAEIAVEAVLGEGEVEQSRSRRGLGVSTSTPRPSVNESSQCQEPASEASTMPSAKRHCYWDSPLWEDIAWELSVSAAPLSTRIAPSSLADAAREALRALGQHIDAHSVWWLSRAMRTADRGSVWIPATLALARLSDPKGTTLADRLAVGPAGDPLGTREWDFLDDDASSSSLRAFRRNGPQPSAIVGTNADSDDESDAEGENELSTPGGWEMSLHSGQVLDADAWRTESGKLMGYPSSQAAERRIVRRAFARRAGPHVIARASLEAESSRVETEDGFKPWHPPGQADPMVRAWHAGSQQSHSAGARRAAYRRLVSGARRWTRLDWKESDIENVVG